MYSCGPTVWDFAHIGNFRAYIFADLLKRFLKFSGYKVDHVMNLTDVDDKTIRNSQQQKVSLKDFTEKYSKFFFEDLQSLNIEPADHYPKATDSIKEMVHIIEVLLKKGVAYKADDGVYFNINKFPTYGQLAHIDVSELKAGASERVATDEYDKQSVHDFALWKFWTDKDGDVKWPAPFGEGRPGWHIECSAMSEKYLGQHFDIHSGGIDLVFPHHQNEIAQSEASTGKKFVNFWLHNEHLIVDGKKMSKSLGNFYTLRDVLKKGVSPMAVRYLLLSVHYRQQLNFTFESLSAAQASVEKINDFYARMVEISEKSVGKSDEHVHELINEAHKRFEKALDDDLNISEALASVYEFMTAINTIEEHLSKKDALAVMAFIDKLNSVLGIIEFERETLPEDVMELLAKREQARKDKDFSLSDQIREQIREKGFQIDDAKGGFRCKRIKKL